MKLNFHFFICDAWSFRNDFINWYSFSLVCSTHSDAMFEDEDEDEEDAFLPGYDM